MDHITIPIPDGVPADQKRELAEWLAKEAASALPTREAFEDDATWQAETARRIKLGMDAADAGQVYSSTEALNRLDAKLGIERNL